MPLRPDRLLLRLFRSLGVGGLATLTDLMALTLLVSGVGVPSRAASIPALVLGAVVQFVGNKRFAFRDRSPDWARQGLQFAGVEMLGFAANALLFDLLVTRTPMPYVVARCLGSFFVYVAICMPLWTRIFKHVEEA